MPTIDEQIARALEESRKSGELESAKSWGKPLREDRAFADTPDEFRLPFKMLKDAGYIPPEVEMLKEIAALQDELANLPSSAPSFEEKRARLIDLRLKAAVRLESMRRSGGL
ncbi:DnaJ family domain-containing protein [Paraburkholderia sp. DHOC27]|uniref:DnaJ family domain-containing protein n=1 Tax=Paraburkholderia sp. DHOC27 TaxID=2303330 RepID=UPI000E3E9538|nr:DnaJ family domain-containing protein [Paraburkholderia sp. DHOC27]RFU48691.1 DUF1992 domain-containing protein [Paraburkholderia sp. DHOC27]